MTAPLSPVTTVPVVAAEKKPPAEVGSLV